MFQPSALSNPAVSTGLITTRMPDLTAAPPKQVQEVLAQSTDAGLSMPVKVAIGVGVAGALGFLVYSLIK